MLNLLTQTLVNIAKLKPNIENITQFHVKIFLPMFVFAINNAV